MGVFFRMSPWYKSVATLGPVGYLPASGTCATAITLAGMYLLHVYNMENIEYIALCMFVCGIALITTHKTLQFLKRYDDPSEIVIDEVVGCMVTFIGISWSAESAFLGFLLFRLFDTTKIAGISYVERLPGAWGVVFDDLCAGVLSSIGLRIILYYWQ